MRVLKALRRSIKGEKENKPHISIAPKSAVAIQPPKKVRLLSACSAHSAHCLAKLPGVPSVGPGVLPIRVTWTTTDVGGLFR